MKSGLIRVITMLLFFESAWRCACFGQGHLLTFTATTSAPIQHSYVGGLDSVYDEHELFFTAPVSHLAAYDGVQIRASAPVGYAWRIHASPFFSKRLRLWCSYGNASDPQGSILFSGTEFAFADSSVGSVEKSDSQCMLPAAGDGFFYNETYSVTGDILFTSYTMTLFYDRSSLADSAPGPGSRAYMQFAAGSVPSDPGPLLTLVAVPEPHALSLVTLGALPLLLPKKSHRKRTSGHTNRTSIKCDDTM